MSAASRTPTSPAEVRAAIGWALRRFRRAAKVANTKRERTTLERGQVALIGLLRRYNTVVGDERKMKADD